MARTASTKAEEISHEYDATPAQGVNYEAYRNYVQSLNAKISETQHLFRQAYKAQADLFMSFLRVPGFESHIDKLTKTFKI